MRSSILESERAQFSAASATLVLFLILGFWYSLVVPPFETPDEIFHYGFVRHLAQGNPLPVQTSQATGPWAHEGTQAPLYYFLAGRLTSGIDQSDFDEINVENPHANLGDPLAPGNKNRMLYSARPLPLRGTNLAVHVDRWFSLALGGLTLWLTYLIARLAFPTSRWLPLAAMLVVASIPQFAFVSASVSNDNMIILLSTAVIYWLARLLVREKSAPIHRSEWVVLGVLVGLAALSKLQGLGVPVLAALVIARLAWQRRAWRLAPQALALMLAPALVISGWWFYRNHTLYGEWLAVNQLLTINGLRGEPQTWRHLWGELRGLRYSFWGLFGWFSILLPTWIYPLLDAITLAALAGLLSSLRFLRRRGADAPWRALSVRIHVLLAAWGTMLMALMLYWATFATSSQGRLLFPAISAFGILFVAGLAALQAGLRWLPRAVLLTPLPLGLLACSVYSLTVLLPSSYHAPAPLASVPSSAQVVNTMHGPDLELLAVDIPHGRFKIGDNVPVTLYLRSTEKLTADYPLFVQLLNQDGKIMGNVTSHAGWGRNPTTLWLPGAIYRDSYLVRVTENASRYSPVLARVYVGFMDPETLYPLPILTVEGEPAPEMLGTVEVAGAKTLDVPGLHLRPVQAAFGEAIQLIGQSETATDLTAGQALTVTLLWEASHAPAGDYTAFVHLLDLDGQQVAGFDQPPAGDRFPTRFWQPGDRILSDFVISLPPDLKPGTYQIWAGLYDPKSPTLARLPVMTKDSTVLHDSLLLGTIMIRPSS